jgi:hypothetical protein
LKGKNLTASQGQAAIRLVPKTSGICEVNNFRQISLLNCDYKVRASVLARRLRQTLASTIGLHKKGGVLGRFFSYNMSLYRDLIQYVEGRGCDVFSNFPIRSMGAALLEWTLKKPTTWEGNKSSERFWGSWTIPLLLSVGYIPLLFLLYIEPLFVRLSQALKGIIFFNENSLPELLLMTSPFFFLLTKILPGQVLDLFCQWTKETMNREKTSATLFLLDTKFSYSIVETANTVRNGAFDSLNGILRENVFFFFVLLSIRE